jgi:DNA primase
LDLIKKFTQDLYECPKALHYLKDIRCFDDNDIKEFELGYCKADIKEFAPNSDLCWLVNRIVIPLRDQYGEIVSYAGRALSDTVKPKIINTSYQKNSYLYGLNKAKENIYTKKYIIIVEGQFDVISCHRNALTNAVGICGSAFSDRQARLILRYTNKAIILGDHDAAGSKAVKRIEDVLRRYYIQTHIIYPPDGIKDADECLRSEFKDLYIKQIHESEE